MQRKNRHSLSGSLISVKRLTPITCSSPLDNLALLEAMFAKVDGVVLSVDSFPRSDEEQWY